MSGNRTDAPPSTALLAAQQELLARRRQRRAERQALGLPVIADEHGRFPHPAPSSPPTNPALPAHLGWHSQAVTAALRRSAPQPQPPTAVSPPAASTPQAPPPPRAPRRHVTLFPDVALGMLRRGQEAAGRIWLLLRHLDRPGQGWLSLGEARKRLTGRQSDLRVCGWRQLRNLLHDGEGVFWHRHNGRLWLRSVVKVAAALHVWRLNSRPVALPVSVLTQRIGQVRAHLYASFHSGRTQAPTRPIARATLHDLTAVLPRTQRRYEKQARVHAQANYALGPRLDTPAAETAAWRQGSAAFALTDGTGRQGPARTTYLAWQLPNAYEGPHAPLSRSRQKWLNRALTDLLMQGTTGNGERAVAARPARRFFGNGKTAVQASPHAAGQPVYWPAPPQGAAHFWYATQHPGYGSTRIGTE